MNLFTILTKFTVIILPFYVFLSVFLTNIIGIPKAGFFIKELVIVLLFLSLIYEYFKAKKLPKLEILDYLVIFYIIYWVWISLFNWLWLNSIIYGWRYDFMFLIVLLIYKHWAEFLKVSIKDILKTFLISASASLLFWFLIKFKRYQHTKKRSSILENLFLNNSIIFWFLKLLLPLHILLHLFFLNRQAFFVFSLP